MAEQIVKSLYGDTVKVVFYPAAHRYKVEGSKTYLTSVTAVTGLIDKSRVLIPWAINLADAHLQAYLEKKETVDVSELKDKIKEAMRRHQDVKDEAASNGSLVHAWAESYANAKIHGTQMPPIGDDLPDQVIAGINAFLDWANSGVEFLETERIVYSRKHGFVGILDARIKKDGKCYIVDYKTSKAVYDEMYFQVSAYANAYQEETLCADGVLIAHFDKETGAFTIKEVSDDDIARDYKAFLGLLTAKERLKERARV